MPLLPHIPCSDRLYSPTEPQLDPPFVKDFITTMKKQLPNKVPLYCLNFFLNLRLYNSAVPFEVSHKGKEYASKKLVTASKTRIWKTLEGCSIPGQARWINQ